MEPVAGPEEREAATAPAGSLRREALGVAVVLGVTGLLLAWILGWEPWRAAFGAVAVAGILVVPYRMLRADRAGLAVLVFLGASVLLLPVSTTTGEQECLRCGSDRTYFRVGWGFLTPWFSFTPRETVTPSRVYADFLGGDHVHRWWLGGERQESLLPAASMLTGQYQACGSGHHNPFGWAYERDEGLRHLVWEEIRKGTVTEDGLRAVFAISLSGKSGQPTPETLVLARQVGAWMGNSDWARRLEGRSR